MAGWVVILLVLTILWLIWEIYKRIDAKGIPGPMRLPILGTSYLFAVNALRGRTNVLEIQQANSRKYNKTFQFFGLFGKPRVIFSNTPESVRHMLVNNFWNYSRDSPTPRFHTLFGKGIFNSNGAQWKSHRKTARPMFTKNNLQLMIPAMERKATILVDQLITAAASKQAVDMQSLFYAFTLDSMGEIGFGVNINSQKENIPFSEAFNRAQITVDRNGLVPYLKFLPDKDFDEDVRIMHEFIGKIIKQRRQEGDYESKKDLLSRFMSIEDPETGEPFPDDYLRDVILNFFIAGRDTTAVLLTWTFYLLSQNPDKLEKLLNEVDTVVPKDQPLDMQTLKNLTYMKNVLSETLRLYPSVPVDGRTAREDDVLPNGTPVPKGSLLLYSAYVIGRDPDYWQDPEKFIPERFDDTTKFTDPLQFVPFHAGPQTCLGQNMAYMEAKIACTKVLQKFTLQVAQGHPVIPHRAIVLPAKFGMKMTVHPRS